MTLSEALFDRIKPDPEFLVAIVSTVKENEMKIHTLSALHQLQLTEDWLQIFQTEKIVNVLAEGIKTLDKHHQLIFPSFLLKWIQNGYQQASSKSLDARHVVKENLSSILVEVNEALKSPNESVFLQGIDTMNLAIKGILSPRIKSSNH